MTEDNTLVIERSQGHIFGKHHYAGADETRARQYYGQERVEEI